MSSISAGLPKQAKRQKRRQPIRTFRISHYWSHALAFVLMVLLVWLLQMWLKQPHNMPIRQLQIEGQLQQLNKEEISLLLSRATEEGFFGVRINALQQSLEQMAWVQAADVRRLWPDRVVVQIQEHEAVAVWNDIRLLSRDGSLFTAETREFSDLLQIRAAEEDKPEVIRRLQQWRPLWELHGLQLHAYQQDARDGVNLQFIDGLNVHLGSEQQSARLRQFSALFPQLIADYPQGLQRVDMRYSNGLAVALKP